MAEFRVQHDEWSGLREDVGYIKAKIEMVADHETRLRLVEDTLATERGAAEGGRWARLSSKAAAWSAVIVTLSFAFSAATGFIHL